MLYRNVSQRLGASCTRGHAKELRFPKFLSRLATCDAVSRESLHLQCRKCQCAATRLCEREKEREWKGFRSYAASLRLHALVAQDRIH
jgi:hypothetical protein